MGKTWFLALGSLFQLGSHTWHTQKHLENILMLNYGNWLSALVFKTSPAGSKVLKSVILWTQSLHLSPFLLAGIWPSKLKFHAWGRSYTVNSQYSKDSEKADLSGRQDMEWGCCMRLTLPVFKRWIRFNF